MCDTPASHVAAACVWTNASELFVMQHRIELTSDYKGCGENSDSYVLHLPLCIEGAK